MTVKIREKRDGETPNSYAPLARARAYRPTWHSKKVRTTKVIKSLTDAFEVDDIQAVVRVWREAMSATTLMWDIKEKKYIESPDHKTRLKAAAIVAAYVEGLPVQRQIQVQTTGNFEELGDLLNRIRESPMAMKKLADLPSLHATPSVPDSLQIGPTVASDDKTIQDNATENKPPSAAEM